MQKINWINGQAGGTPLSAENLNLMQENAEDAIDDVQDNVDLIKNYSLNETAIGKWFNGKTLYRKVISCGTLPNATSKDINHGIENLDKIVKLEGYTTNGTFFLPLPFAESGGQVNTSISFFVSNSYIRITTGIDRTSFTETYIILEYTKTA